MIRVHYIEPNGTDHEIDVEPGRSVMEGAVKNGLPGIDADCGGQCACATCHVFIDPAWSQAVGPPSPDEADMLEFVIGVNERSRLSCQVSVEPGLDGLVVHLPEQQGTA